MKGAHAHRLVRSSCSARAPLGSEHSVLVHLLGEQALVCSSRVLAVLDCFDEPRTVAAVAAKLGVEPSYIEPVINAFREADVLVSGPPEQDQIRALYGQRFHDGEIEANEPPVSGPADDSELDFGVDDGTCLVLSRSLASLRLGGDVLLRHPVSRPLHLDGSLYRIALAFRRPTTVRQARRRLGRRGGDVLLAARLLVRRSVLWRSLEEEATALAARYGTPSDDVDLDASDLGPEALAMKLRAYRPADLRPIRRSATVALFGGCQAQSYIQAMQLLAERAGWHLDVRGFNDPSRPGLAEAEWDYVFGSVAWVAYELYQAIGVGDLAEARRLVPRTIALFDAEIDLLRRYTRSPIALHSLGRPDWLPAAPASPLSLELAAVLADANRRILAGLKRHERVYVLDEDAVVRRYAIGSHYNDAFHGSWHHAPVTLWGAAPQRLPSSGRPDEDGLREIDYTSPGAVPPRHPWQGNPAFPFARAYLDALLAHLGDRPVRLVVFEPNELLWPGRIEHRKEVRGRGAWLLGPHWPYTAMNEALLAVRRRGVALACLSSCPREELLDKWSRAPGETAVVPSDVQFVVGGGRREQMIRQLAQEAGVSQEEMLLVDLSRPPPRGFRGRVYQGNRWGLKRYLLAAPELSCPHEPVRVPRRAVATHAASDAVDRPRDVVRTVTELAATQLARPIQAVEATDDLRLLGLDSLSAVELVHSIENQLGARIAERDFLPGVLFSKSGLIGAASRAVERRVSPEASPTTSRELPVEDYDEWTSLDMAALLRRHIAHPPSPWAVKLVRSAERHDAEYLTWGRLGEMAAAYAAQFTSEHVPAGAVVTLLLPSGAELVAAWVGAVLGGYIPSISAFPNEKLPVAAFAEWFAATVERSGSPYVLCYPEIRNEIERQLHARGLEIKVSSESPGAMNAASNLAPLAVRPDAPALLQQSSGTTGLKKAVLLNHRAVLAQTWLLARSLKCASDDVIVSWLPLYHDMGLIACQVLPLLMGLPVVMMSPFTWVRRPELLLEEISREHGTLCWLPNFAYSHLARRVREDAAVDIDLSSLRMVVSCSEPITGDAMDALLRRFAAWGLRRSALSSSYAMAEATFAVTQSPPGRSSRRIRVDRAKLEKHGVLHPVDDSNPEGSLELVSSGQVLPRFEVRIVDSSGAPLPDCSIGEICIRGESLMESYFNDPNETNAAVKDGWYHSGDLGALVRDELYVSGRRKDLIIVAGQNVYPHFVEEATFDVPGVYPGRAVAFGVFEPAEGTERLVVLVEPRDGEMKEDLASRVSEALLARFQIPADVRVVAAGTLKKSTSGKLSRSANRQLYLDNLAVRSEWHD